MKTNCIARERLYLSEILAALILSCCVMFVSCGRDSKADTSDSLAADSAAAGTADSSAVIADSGSKAANDSLAKADSTKKAEEQKREASAVPVEVAVVERGEVHDFILQNSTVDTEEGVDVYSRQVGEVVKLNVEEGSRVAKGAVLCSLVDDDYRLARDKSKVNYQKLQADYKRFKEMYEKQLISTKEVEESGYNLEQARLDYERSELDFQRTRITAPIAGVVTSRLVKLGERVTAAQPLFRIVEMVDKIALIRVPEREIGRLRSGQPAYLTTDNLPGRKFAAGIKRIAPAVDPASGTFKVTVGLKDPQGELRPGMFVAVHIITDTHPNALLIPKEALVYENGLAHAFIVEQDTVARRVRLEPGFSDGKYMEALSSINEHDKVVIVGQNGLKDGSRVKVVAGLLKESEPLADKSTATGKNAI